MLHCQGGPEADALAKKPLRDWPLNHAWRGFFIAPQAHGGWSGAVVSRGSDRQVPLPGPVREAPARSGIEAGLNERGWSKGAECLKMYTCV